MKVLGIYTTSKGKEIGPVDRWRVKYPFEELQKHTDWDISMRKNFLEGTSEEIKAEELQGHLDKFADIDLVWSSYYSNKMQYAFVKMVEAHHKTKFVLDVDDDIYTVPEHNPFWIMMNAELVHGMQRMVETSEYVVTTNERLAEKLREQRRGYPAENTLVIPNYISAEKHQHPEYDNGDRVKIGYFGGASHYMDLNKTNFSRALQKIMRTYKNVDFELYGWWGKKNHNEKSKVIGSLIEHSLPPTRTMYHKGKRGEAWYDLYKSINLDIACGPLVKDRFNEGKSDIKWQESALMGAAFVGSNVGPYRDTINNVEDGYLVENTLDEWYGALEKLVTDAAERKRIANNAKKRVLEDFTIENNWHKYKEVINKIVKEQQ